MNTTGNTTNWNDYCFERTVYANIKLSKLCPGHDISKLGEVLEDPDTEKQFNSMMDIVLIMNEAYIRKYKRIEPEKEFKAISREELLDLDEDTFMNVVMIAMGKFEQDGDVSVIAEPKKEEAEETESSSMNPGSSTSATSLE